MKLFLIKIGKAVSILKRDGFKAVLYRVTEGLKLMFRPVKPGDVLFISGGVGDSSRYGCFHQAEELEEHGIRSSVTVVDNPRLASYADRFQVFIFHRTIFTPNVQKLFQKVKQQGKTILYATDDLVFDAQYFKHMDYLRNANAMEKKLYEKGVGEELLNDPYLQYCVVTTEFLKEKLEQAGKKVFVSLNKLSKEDMKNIQQILLKPEVLQDGLVRIGYFSGTITHNKDFAIVAPVIRRLLDRHENLRLVLVGPLDVPSEMDSLSGQVERWPFVPRREHFANIAKVDINIAPLEIDNPFCQAKSELKFFEAGAVQVPTVASATAVYRSAIADGQDGFVAENEREWEEKLEQLVSDPELRRRMGEKARAKVLEKYTTVSSGNELYYQFLKSRITGGDNLSQ